jgi:heme exporter protein A
MTGMNGPNPLLTAESLAVTRGGRLVFEAVSLTLRPGQFIALRGANGAGKSSLLLTLAGALSPEAGTIGPAEREPLHLLAHSSAIKTRLTLAENLDFWRRINGETGLLPTAALDRVGLGGLGGIEAGHLSAGQTRRLALARLLASDRRLWLLDEPLAALDESGSALVEALIAERLATGGGVIAASHDDIAGTTSTLRLGGAT